MKGRKYPFLIANTDRSEISRMHWQNILDISLASDFLVLDTFSIEGLKNFIIQDNKKIAEKVIKGIEKMDRKDNKLTLFKLNFLVKNFRELKDIEKLLLSETAQDFFHFVENFREYKNQKYLNIWMLEDPIQKTETSTCRPFQI